ncbi:MAG: hypothetical protein ABW061_20975, partial [Polyangiaceae bacterium]
MKLLMKMSLSVAAAALVACSSDASTPAEPDNSTPAQSDARYVVGSLLFGDETTTAYVNILHSLGAQTIDYEQAREFSGAADLWVDHG